MKVLPVIKQSMMLLVADIAERQVQMAAAVVVLIMVVAVVVQMLLIVQVILRIGVEMEFLTKQHRDGLQHGILKHQ